MQHHSPVLLVSVLASYYSVPLALALFMLRVAKGADYLKCPM